MEPLLRLVEVLGHDGGQGDAAGLGGEDHGDLVHVEFLGKIGKLALYRIGIVTKYLFIIFGFRREVFLPELPRNAGLLLLYLVSDSLPFAVKAHFVSPILYLFLFLMYESTNPHVLSRNSFIFLFS